jgi:DNA polymerase III sliding clamp (beta) subunit (PCNA family)
MKFMAQATDLKKAVSIASLATGDTADNIKGHALITVTGEKALIHATDEDRIAFTEFSVTNVEGDMVFTIDPKNILALLSSADRKDILFDYDKETKTLNAYASDDDSAYLSFPSLDPDSFLSFGDEVTSATLVDTINTTIFTTALKYQQGFVSQDEKNKFANTFIREGVFYGTNGQTKIGLFQSPDTAKIFSMTIRKQMIGALLNFMDKINQDNVCLKDTEKKCIITSPDGSCGIGFRKSSVEAPKIPISPEMPTEDGLIVDREMFLKKISRLAIVAKGDILSLTVTVNGQTLSLQTNSDRKSVESMSCIRIGTDTPMTFLIECQQFKSILSMFLTPKIKVFIIKSTCMIFSEADILIGEKDPIKKSYLEVARLSLPRDVAV